MKKSAFIFLFVFFSNNLFAQGFGVTSKYSTNFGNSYVAYTSLSLEGFFSINNNMFEVGPTIGFIYSEPRIDFSFHIPEYYYVDVIDIAKASIGIFAYYYPIVFDSTYSPFISIKWEKLNRWRSLSQITKSGANNISKPNQDYIALLQKMILHSHFQLDLKL